MQGINIQPTKQRGSNHWQGVPTNPPGKEYVQVLLQSQEELKMSKG